MSSLTEIQLEGYGLIACSWWSPRKTGANELAIGERRRAKYAAFAWGIEISRWALKQKHHVEQAQVRATRTQRDRIGLAIRAFARLEWHRLCTGSVGERHGQLSSEMRYGPIWLILTTYFPQLRNGHVGQPTYNTDSC